MFRVSIHGGELKSDGTHSAPFLEFLFLDEPHAGDDSLGDGRMEACGGNNGGGEGNRLAWPKVAAHSLVKLVHTI